MRVLVLHGPNMARLGEREPELYGDRTLGELELLIVEAGRELGVTVSCAQSDLEGELVRAIGASDHDGIILNPAAFTHTSVALRDAVSASGVPVIEVHLSNLHAREPFRRRSVIAGVSWGQISGLGVHGYAAALTALVRARTGESR